MIRGFFSWIVRFVISGNTEPKAIAANSDASCDDDDQETINNVSSNISLDRASEVDVVNNGAEAVGNDEETSCRTDGRKTVAHAMDQERRHSNYSYLFNTRECYDGEFDFGNSGDRALQAEGSFEILSLPDLEQMFSAVSYDDSTNGTAHKVESESFYDFSENPTREKGQTRWENNRNDHPIERGEREVSPPDDEDAESSPRSKSFSPGGVEEVFSFTNVQQNLEHESEKRNDHYNRGVLEIDCGAAWRSLEKEFS